MLEVTSQDAADGSRTYVVRGQVFFASAVQFANSFDYLHASRQVLIDLTQAHFWDTSAVAALDRVVLKLRKHGASVRSEEHTSELQSLMRISYAVFCLKKKKKTEAS